MYIPGRPKARYDGGRIEERDRRRGRGGEKREGGERRGEEGRGLK